MNGVKKFACGVVVSAALAMNSFAENYGNSTTNVGADAVVTFTESGTFRLAEASTVRVLLVGGGGAGGTRIGGGGGGGGVVDTNLVLAAGDYAIVVGSGGAGTAPVNNNGGRGGNGGASTFSGDGIATLVALGG